MLHDSRPPAPPTNPHSDLSHAPRDRDFPTAMAARVMREVSRVCAVATEIEATEILLILSERFGDLIPAPKPFTPQVDDAESVFPGIFHGRRAGDFAGLPPVPDQVTRRVPELAIRLSGIADELSEAWRQNGWQLAVPMISRVMSKLHAVVDEIEAEAGVQ